MIQNNRCLSLSITELSTTGSSSVAMVGGMSDLYWRDASLNTVVVCMEEMHLFNTLEFCIEEMHLPIH